jgi:flagellar motility protein MotE (MotC chaperone)
MTMPSLRQAVRPAIYAHRLLAGDQERAAKLAAECEELLSLTRQLVKAIGLARLLDTGPATGNTATGTAAGTAAGTDSRQEQILDAYADAAMGWAKVIGSFTALAGTLLERNEWDEVRRLAGVLADAGELGAASDLRAHLGKVIWASYANRLRNITSAMPPAEIAKAIAALRAILREVPEDFPDRNAEVNRLLVPLAAAVQAVIHERRTDIPYDSRVGHIAAGGVAKYPEIVAMSLDELAAEFDGN